MEPVYFNLGNPQVSANYIGTNPLEGFTMEPIYMDPAYFNPSLYQSFTFDQFPSLSVYSTTFLGGNDGGISATTNGSLHYAAIISSTNYDPGGGVDDTAIATAIFYSTYDSFFTQFSTFKTDYASYQMLQSITFSQRFGTELQTVYNAEFYATDTWNTYEYIFTEQVRYYSTAVQSLYRFDGDTEWSTYDITDVSTIASTIVGSGFISNNTTAPSVYAYPSSSPFVVGSSMFVQMLGSDVYTGLLITTDSVIVYQNEQISSYYSESLSYQVNIANLTAALNSVSTTTDNNESGWGTITVTLFAWTWYTTTGGWSGSQLTNFSSYLYTQIVNDYLSQNYGGTVITSSSEAVSQVQSLITTQNNELANSQTFLNNAVTTLQSQVSLAGQIISSLASSTQSIIGNI